MPGKLLRPFRFRCGVNAFGNEITREFTDNSNSQSQGRTTNTPTPTALTRRRERDQNPPEHACRNIGNDLLPHLSATACDRRVHFTSTKMLPWCALLQISTSTRLTVLRQTRASQGSRPIQDTALPQPCRLSALSHIPPCTALSGSLLVFSQFGKHQTHLSCGCQGNCHSPVRAPELAPPTETSKTLAIRNQCDFRSRILGHERSCERLLSVVGGKFRR